MTILVLDFCKLNFLCLNDDYTSLFSTKDATGKVWIGLTDLYEVVTCCDSALPLLKCKTIWNKLETHLPLSQNCMKNLMNHFPFNGLLILLQFYGHLTVSGHQFTNFCKCFWILSSCKLPTPRVTFKVSSPSQNTSNHSGTGICYKIPFPKTLSNISCDSVAVS
jgi:hypothetical protein